jgi:protein arginine N-methyltransferase 1
MTWTAERPGTAHGILVWFDTQLLEGIGFSNAPGEPKLIYGQAFFPLEQPIDLAVGEQVVVRLAANLVAREYVWRWETEVFSVAAFSSVRRSLPERRLRFQQSTFLGGAFGIEKLRRSEAGYVPRLSASGQMDCYLLSLIDGQLSLGEIARQAAERSPHQFPRWQDALTRVAELADKFGQ